MAQAPPCRFFFSPRGCRNGDACRFSHERAAVPQQQQQPAESAYSREAGPGGGEGLIAAIEVGQAPAYSLDVECVATGPTHLDRAVAQIGLVDAGPTPILNLYVKPAAPVVSYLTPLTGLTSEVIEAHGVPLAEAVAVLRRHLPPSAILVGTNVGQDAAWLGLTSPNDFASLLDLTALFRVWDAAARRYTAFSQDHVAKAWLPAGDTARRDPGVAHDALADASISMRLFHEYRAARADPPRLAANRARTLALPREPSFAVRHPVFEGVCQGNRRLCRCGAPHFS